MVNYVLLEGVAALAWSDRGLHPAASMGRPSREQFGSPLWFFVATVHRRMLR
jgi:hypothetical protein